MFYFLHDFNIVYLKIQIELLNITYIIIVQAVDYTILNGIFYLI